MNYIRFRIVFGSIRCFMQPGRNHCVGLRPNLLCGFQPVSRIVLIYKERGISLKNNDKQIGQIKDRFLKLINIVLVMIPFAIYDSFVLGASQFAGRDRIYVWMQALLFMLVYSLATRTYDAFYIKYSKISELIYSQVLSVLVADALMFVVIWILLRQFPPFLLALLTLAVQILLIIIWVYLVHQWYFKTNPPLKTAVIWDQRKDFLELIDSYGLNKRFEVIRDSNVEDCINDLSILDSVEVVFMCGVRSHERNIIMKACIANDTPVFMIPRIGDVIMSGARNMHMFHLPVLRVARYDPSPEYLFTKRLLDLVISGIGLVITSPIMLATAIAIRATDGGPVFYKQTRLTKDGQLFQVLKFRSMRVDAEKDGIARLSTGENDDRITPVGRVIRSCRIDELPQLINILKGDMSIVGPRPERPEIAEQYVAELPEFNLRLQAKCGLTGYAQVYGKYNTTPYDKLQMDLMYLAKPSIAQDLEIMMATVKILFMPESTEGVSEGHITIMRKKSE